jgi:hypothetical protein
MALRDNPENHDYRHGNQAAEIELIESSASVTE